MADHREKESFITKVNSLTWYWKGVITIVLFFTLIMIFGTIAGATQSCP